MNTYPKNWTRRLAQVAVGVLLIYLVVPFNANAAQITARKLTLGSSSPLASTTYTFNFTVPTTATNVLSWEAQVCLTPSGSCTMPPGFVNSSSITQPTGLGDATGWTGNTATAGSLRMSNGGNATAPSGSQIVTFNAVTNPNTANQTLYARMTTYSAANWTGAIDTGTVAASTANQIQLTGTMDESLVFCTGTSITGTNCATATGTSVNFGTFSTTATMSGTSVMAASTNGQSGYSITLTGATLTSGANTIAAMGVQSANGAAAVSSTGTSQFGLNLRANTTPAVGANVSGTGAGTYGTNYGTADSYRFFTGDTVGTSTTATDANTFTVSYIVNVAGSQPSGTYAATMTYICTATF
ncbi:MAG TPA: hypothetical protein VMR98_00065 [Candidatus Polarisedimenticolaceae bacterium]|nr:hypothetical protein [Candidatus Polarisedimenticolaceae bacterium]